MTRRRLSFNLVHKSYNSIFQATLVQTVQITKILYEEICLVRPSSIDFPGLKIDGCVGHKIQITHLENYDAIFACG